MRANLFVSVVHGEWVPNEHGFNSKTGIEIK